MGTDADRRGDDTDPLPVLPPPSAPPPDRATPARRRGRRWLLGVAGAVAFAAVVGILIANAVIARSAEQAAAEEIAGSLGAPADVRLRGWPAGLRLLATGTADVRVRARDVPLEGTAATIATLELELDDVVVPRDRDAAGGAVQARAARFSAELDDDAVQQLIGALGRIPLVDVELRNGVARLTFARVPVIDASAEVEAGRVVFRPTAPVGAFVQVELGLGALPLGFRADSVEIRRDRLRLTGSATDVRLEAGPAADARSRAAAV